MNGRAPILKVFTIQWGELDMDANNYNMRQNRKRENPDQEEESMPVWGRGGKENSLIILREIGCYWYGQK